jgi:NAD(P)H-dependent FMN reductase
MIADSKRIVGLSGSLRAHSSNAALVRAAFALVPAGTETVLFEGIGLLPHFNPDLDQEGDAPPPAVAELRALLRSADGFIVSVPEYAHGLPGAFKNALDWLVSSGELAHKPVLVLNASPARGHHAQANLVATLTVIEARVLTGETATLQRSVAALMAAIAPAP